ncbi:hypothetical protein U9M48_001560 [Paspalum notatum var. saurae]|uniref:Uncharacterized protein n=1 Tax=Paspalum notatum var. saurae TaxID=547442 RepID=A0AAQ3PM79_PASNO
MGAALCGAPRHLPPQPHRHLLPPTDTCCRGPGCAVVRWRWRALVGRETPSSSFGAVGCSALPSISTVDDSAAGAVAVRCSSTRYGVSEGWLAGATGIRELPSPSAVTVPLSPAGRMDLVDADSGVGVVLARWPAAGADHRCGLSHVASLRRSLRPLAESVWDGADARTQPRCLLDLPGLLSVG